MIACAEFYFHQIAAEIISQNSSREAKFRQQQKNGWKSRFGELSTEEIQVIMDKAVPETTKKATKFGMRLFNGMYC